MGNRSNSYVEKTSNISKKIEESKFMESKNYMTKTDQNRSLSVISNTSNVSNRSRIFDNQLKNNTVENVLGGKSETSKLKIDPKSFDIQNIYDKYSTENQTEHTNSKSPNYDIAKEVPQYSQPKELELTNKSNRKIDSESYKNPDQKKRRNSTKNYGKNPSDRT